MIIKGIIDCDFINYKKPSLVIAMPRCNFKCDKENGKKLCQNGHLAQAKNIEISAEKIISEYYITNPLTKAVVFQGLEPFDSFGEVLDFIDKFRQISNDEIIIYTGYYEYEIIPQIEQLKKYPNIIIKFGRFIPNDSPVLDEILGVKLASKNQFGRRIS